MTVDITQIPYANFGPNSLITIRVPAFGLQERATIDALTKGLRNNVDDSVTVLILRDDMSIELVSERIMNEAGWFRKTDVL